MDVLKNEDLLTMVKAWQDYVAVTGGTTVHSHLRRVMEELRYRGIVDEDRVYVADLEMVDRKFRRV